MVTFKKFKYVIFSLLALAVIASATAFSVSYAKWVSPTTDSVNANLSTGEWGNSTVSTTDYGVVVGNKIYNSAKQSDGTYSCIFKVKHGDAFKIYCGGTELGCNIDATSLGMQTGISVSGTEFSYDKNWRSDIYEFIPPYDGEEEQYITVTFSSGDGVTSISVINFSSNLNIDNVVEILGSYSCKKGILTSNFDVINFDSLGNGKTIELGIGEQFYIVDIFDNLAFCPRLDVDNIVLKSEYYEGNRTTLYTMQGNGTISVSKTGSNITINISVEGSGNKTVISYDSGLWSVEQ